MFNLDEHLIDEPLRTVGILIVDDRPESLLVLETVLEPLGQRLVRAPSGQDALDAARAERFAVILMDIRMPGMDGFETMKRLRQQEGRRRVPIIFISAADEQKEVYESYSSGAVDYIRKPIDAEALRCKVSVFVHLRQHELALQAAHAEVEQRVAERTAQLAEANTALAREIVDRKAAEQRLVERAFHDSLTGLANRSLFMVHLARAHGRARRRPAAGFAVLMLDVDRFKVINDSLGHLAGDAFLTVLAARLAGCVREVDTVARLGGDEFAILLDGSHDLKDATRWTERLLAALDTPFKIEGKEVFASLSIGITMMSERYARPEDLLRDADSAMYRAKSGGRGRYQVFDVAMHEGVVAQLHLEADLRRALERREFRLHYQPIVSVTRGKVEAVEALVRWQHPERGLLLPTDFIPLAEETGLIRQVGGWVLRESCRQLGAWQRGGLRNLVMNVNVSARQFADPNLPHEIESAANEAGVRFSDIALELTESVVMTGAGEPETILARLAELGVSICLDDFGTGYSCLSYLHRFPVSTLKIDKSFVTRIGARDDRAEIVHTIVAMAQSLDMGVIAEGVETCQQLERVRTLGCEHAQGYHLARPLEAAAAELLLRQDRRLPSVSSSSRNDDAAD
jgi:diguanylate cyclase (GGDEF)-like protein